MGLDVKVVQELTKIWDFVWFEVPVHVITLFCFPLNQILITGWVLFFGEGVPSLLQVRNSTCVA